MLYAVDEGNKTLYYFLMQGNFLHGNVKDKSSVALLLIDVINDFNFPEAADLIKFAVPMAKNISDLKKLCRMLEVPVIYVNDNFGIWRSNFESVLKHCLRDDCMGKEIAELLSPAESDYFVLKPKHSGFYSTTLGILLDYLECNTLILCGLAGNICVLFTANDAYMRDYKLFIPSDCVASNTQQENKHALTQMSKILKADIRPSTELTRHSLEQIINAGAERFE